MPAILQRLAETGCRDEPFEACWREIAEEREDPARYAWRKLEALLGRDPDTGPEEELLALQREEPVMGPAAVAEVAAAVPERPLAVIRSLREEARPRALPAQIPEDANLRRRVAEETRPGQGKPWVQGEAAAAAARTAWNIPPAPLTTLFCAGSFRWPGIFSRRRRREHPGRASPLPQASETGQPPERWRCISSGAFPPAGGLPFCAWWVTT
ncbi:MAG: hypothetical protein GX442_21135 [Candidatus Riflebacteria bacterium]|nr:hypothetical protein [Candidatus Riflebacteria bacterium]